MYLYNISHKIVIFHFGGRKLANTSTVGKKKALSLEVTGLGSRCLV